MAQAMAPYHGAYISHIRSEDDQLLEAIDEAFLIGRSAGVPVDIYHLKAATRRNWGKARAMVAKIDSARKAGLDAGATMYPYPASSNSLQACIPNWASANDMLLQNLRDPAKRARIVREMGDTTPGANQGCQLDGPSAIMVVGLQTDANRKYEGWRLDRIAADRGTTWENAHVDLLLAKQGRVAKITFSMGKTNVAMQLARPWNAIGNDAQGIEPATSADLRRSL